MKTFYLLMAFFAITTAQAGELKPAQPLRQAKLTGKVYRSDAKNENHYEKVCDFSGNVPVYGPLENDSSQAMGEVANCESQIDGKLAFVSVSGIIHPGKAIDGSERKAALLSVMVNVKDNETGYAIYSAQNASTGSKDLQARNLYLSMTSPSYFSAGSNPPATYFWAVAEFDDLNQ